MTLHNLARMTSATTGTGTLTLGSAVDGFLSFADAGVADAEKVPYSIRDGSASEVGLGTYTSSGTTLSRDTIYESTNGGAAINCSGGQEVFITVLAETLSGRRELISSSSPGGAATATFSSIPGYYTTLEIDFLVRSAQSAASDVIVIEMNTDTTAANYRTLRIIGYGANSILTSGTDDKYAANVSAANSPANSAGTGRIVIPFYAGTTFKKTLTANWTYREDTGTNEGVTGQTGVEWESTAAITRIDLKLLSGANFAAGSTIRLYGIF